MRAIECFSLPIETATRLNAHAQAIATPKSQIVRAALTQYLDSAEQVNTEEQTAKVCDLVLGPPSRRKK